MVPNIHLPRRAVRFRLVLYMRCIALRKMYVFVRSNGRCSKFSVASVLLQIRIVLRRPQMSWTYWILIELGIVVAFVNSVMKIVSSPEDGRIPYKECLPLTNGHRFFSSTTLSIATILQWCDFSWSFRGGKQIVYRNVGICTRPPIYRILQSIEYLKNGTVLIFIVLLFWIFRHLKKQNILELYIDFSIFNSLNILFILLIKILKYNGIITFIFSYKNNFLNI